MKQGKFILLILAIVIIIGAIIMLESRKAGPARSPSSEGADDIEIEEVFEVASEIGTTTSENEPAEQEPTAELTTEPEMSTSEAETQQEPEKKAISQTRAETIAEKAEQYERAKEISTPDHFINTDPLTVQELIGEKVILVDFWTYSCINCQRTTPYLNAWYDRYAEDGLVILGIHTPEFEFEKDITNVERATEALGIEYPVIMDNDYSTWSAYRNNYWPRKYIIDIDGFIVYDHIGEGAYEDTEKKIVELLNEKNDVLGIETEVVLKMSEPEDVDAVDFTKIQTHESYFGYERVEYLANEDEECHGVICDYELPDDVPLNQFALSGEWQMGSEESTLTAEPGAIVSHFSANKVNLVAGSDEPVTARVLLDGEPIAPEFAGSDVMDGEVTFEEHSLYNLVDLKGEYSEHTVEIRFEEEGVSAFAFTFG